MNMKFVRTWAMLALVMVIGLSVTGGTIAWFTDSVSSTNNVIKSGNLKIKLTANDTEITDGSTTPIFNYSFWEPGYTTTAKLKIENAGDLALKYTFGINPESVTTDEAYNLADVIDVYVFDAGTEVTRAAVNAATPVGTLTSLSTTGFFSGVLLPAEGEGATDVNPDSAPKGSVEKILVLKMKESADNNYQNLSLNNLTIKLDATQYTYEKDAFDHNYDLNTESKPEDLPKADVDPYDPTGITFTTLNTEIDRELDTAYTFKTTESYNEAENSPYAKWHADFAVSFNQDVKPNTVGLAGSYESYQNGAWIGFDIDEEIVNAVGENGVIPAHTPIRLLATAGITMNYEELCLLVEEFNCGAFAIGDDIAGTTMYVDLRLYETEAPSESNGNSVNVEVVPEHAYTVHREPYTF